MPRAGPVTGVMAQILHDEFEVPMDQAQRCRSRPSFLSLRCDADDLPTERPHADGNVDGRLQAPPGE